MTHTSRKFKIRIRAIDAYIFLFLLVLSFTFHVSPVLAQRVSLSISPPHIEVLMRSDTSLIKAFNIQNSSDPGVFNLRVVSFEPSGDQGDRIFKEKAEGPIRFSLENSDLKLDKPFFMKANEDFQVLLKIRSIENAPLGDYYYTLFVITEPPVGQSSMGKGSAWLGANILISISETGLKVVEGKIAQFQVIPRYQFKLFGRSFAIIEPRDQVPVILKMANIGQYLIQPEAKIELKGPFSTKQKRKLLPLNVLKQSERVLYPKELDECERCQTNPSVVFKGFYFGKYLLTADINFLGSNQKVFAKTEFWALPIRLTVIVVLLFIFSLFVLLFKRKNN